jgi:hypothetical protein
VVREELDRQVEADGAHFERSTYYHVYAVDMFLLHAVLAAPDRLYREKLARMVEFLSALLGDSGAIPLIGDDDGGRLWFPYGSRVRFGRATVAACSVFLGLKYWPYESEDLHPAATWLFGERVREPLPSCASTGGSRLFRDSGIAVLRAGPLKVVVDAGSFGPGNAGHSHSDTLSLCIRLGDEELLLDPGTYTYVADPLWRNRFRGSAAHNTVRVDGCDQAQAAGPFRWRAKPVVRIQSWDSSEDADFLDASCMTQTGNGLVTHRRRVLLLKPNAVLIVDDVDGPPGNHLLEQFWHAGAEVRNGAPGTIRIGPSWLAFAEDIPLEVIEGEQLGWKSDVFGAKSPAAVVRRHWRTAFPARLSTVLALREEWARFSTEEGGSFHFPERGLTVRFPQEGKPLWTNGQFPSNPLCGIL